MVDIVYEQHGSTMMRVIVSSSGSIRQVSKAVGTPAQIKPKHKGEFKKK